MASQRSDYRLFVGVPLANPSRWEAVTKAADGYLLLGEQGKLSLADVDAFIVAYPNGQLVDENMANLKLPPGITGLSPVLDRDLDRLQLSDLKSGNQIIQIKYDRSPAAPNDRNRYSTSLNNLSKEKIKVVRFAGYRRENQEWKISTVTGKFFSAEEFSAWYGLEDSKWILPGKTVVDMNNYGSPPMLWAYHCETESGRSFVAGAVVE